MCAPLPWLVVNVPSHVRVHGSWSWQPPSTRSAWWRPPSSSRRRRPSSCSRRTTSASGSPRCAATVKAAEHACRGTRNQRWARLAPRQHSLVLMPNAAEIGTRLELDSRFGTCISSGPSANGELLHDPTAPRNLRPTPPMSPHALMSRAPRVKVWTSRASTFGRCWTSFSTFSTPRSRAPPRWAARRRPASSSRSCPPATWTSPRPAAAASFLPRVLPTTPWTPRPQRPTLQLLLSSPASPVHRTEQ